jgi:hypothetical protein
MLSRNLQKMQILRLPFTSLKVAKHDSFLRVS